MNASIGVCIPCKNYARFLPDAVQSLGKQGIANLAAVVVDDGSDDAKAVECAAWGVPVVRLATSRGIGIARNIGAAYLNTDLILFLDADDWLHAGAVKELAALLTERPGASFAYGDYTENGQTIITPRWSEGRALLDTQNIASYCNLWRRGAFSEIGGYSDIAVAEDWELQKRAYRAGLVGAKADVSVFEHRLHKANKWQKDSAKYGGMAGVAKELENYGR